MQQKQSELLRYKKLDCANCGNNTVALKAAPKHFRVQVHLPQTSKYALRGALLSRVPLRCTLQGVFKTGSTQYELRCLFVLTPGHHTVWIR